MKNLKNKTALVTGSTSGIGLGIALRLADAGVNILLHGLEDPAPAIEKIKAYGVRCEYHDADLRSSSQISEMFEFAVSVFGGIDILINNAGIQHVAEIESLPSDKWDSILAINLTAAFHTTRFALGQMKAKGWGRIVNVASVHGLVGSVGKSAYVASKHGLIGLTKVAALETATTNITCNAVCPGFVSTPLLEQQILARAQITGSIDSAQEAMFKEKQPSMAMVTVQQLGGLVLFLCSEDGQQVRGAAWNMDGGWVAV